MASGLELISRMWEEESWREFYPGEGRSPKSLFLRSAGGEEKVDLARRKVPLQISLTKFYPGLEPASSSLSLSLS